MVKNSTLIAYNELGSPEFAVDNTSEGIVPSQEVVKMSFPHAVGLDDKDLATMNLGWGLAIAPLSSISEITYSFLCEFIIMD